MLAVAVWLVTIGLCDLLRAARDATSMRRRALITLFGAALLACFGVALDLTATQWWWLCGGWVLTLFAWVFASSAALAHRERASTGALSVAFGSLLVGLAVTVLGGGTVRTGVEFPAVLQGGILSHLLLEELALLAGVVLFQLSSANVVVRLLLDAVGVPATSNEKQLKGGRLLGPMERLFIVGLGLAGAVTAAAVVVAAKGLLRFPELQRGLEESGPTDVTEYFLVGSFASWLIALGGLALLVV